MSSELVLEIAVAVLAVIATLFGAKWSASAALLRAVAEGVETYAKAKNNLPNRAVKQVVQSAALMHGVEKSLNKLVTKWFPDDAPNESGQPRPPKQSEPGRI